MKKVLKMVLCLAAAIAAMLTVSLCIFAENADSAEAASTVVAVQEETAEADSTSSKAWAAGIAIGLAALGGAIAMGMAIGKSSEAISRQPEAESKIRTSLMLGLVFIETAIIYALIIAILIIFVL